MTHRADLCLRRCGGAALLAAGLGWAGCAAETTSAAPARTAGTIPTQAGPTPPAPSPPATPDVPASTLHVEGNHFVDHGKTVRLLGVNHSGTESSCRHWNGESTLFQG